MITGMRVIATSTLRDFWINNPDSEQPLKAWFEEAVLAQWTQPMDIKTQFRNASILKNRRVVFNIKGNDYRLVAIVLFNIKMVYIRFIGTHKEYDKTDCSNI